MQNRNTYGGTGEREEIRGEGGPAKRWEQVFASSLPALYRRAYRMLGNAADAEDAVQDALLAAYTHLYPPRSVQRGVSDLYVADCHSG